MLRPGLAGGLTASASPAKAPLLRRFAHTFPAVAASPLLRISIPSASWSCGLQRLRREQKVPSTSIVAYAKSSRRSLGSGGLKDVPGVGHKYEKLLNARNVFTEADLLAIYRQKCKGDTTLMESWLQAAGIGNAGFQKTMCEYLACQPATAAPTSSASSTGSQGTQVRGTPNSSSSSTTTTRATTGRLGTGSGTGGSGSLSSSPPGEVGSWLFPKVTLSVEGNISAGKSTFLRLLEQAPALKGKLQLVPEPVEKWQSVGGGKVNLLMEFYRSPERFAYTFQNYVFLTRVMQERESYVNPAIHRLLERSIFSDRMVFVRAVHAAKYMNDTELAIYDSWFDPILNTLPTLIPNGFIYLRASPETCHQRLKRRGREEEDTVKLDYLAMLHRCHEDWLYQGGDPLPASGPRSQPYVWAARAPTSSSSEGSGAGSSHQYTFSIHPHPPSEREVRDLQVGWSQLPQPRASLDGCIRFMDCTRAPHMHPRLHTVPSLVVDCEEDVDIGRDDDHEARILKTVVDFSDYVRGVILARGEALAAHERLVASQQAHRRISSAAAAPPAPAPDSSSAGFSGYAMEVGGATLYVAPSAPLLAFATAEGAVLGAGAPPAPPASPDTSVGSPTTTAAQGPAQGADDDRVPTTTASSDAGSSNGTQARQLQGKQQQQGSAGASSQQQQQPTPATT